MADHIPVGKIGDDQIIVFFDAVQHFLGDLRQAQSRDLVERNTSWGGNTNIFFIGKRLVVAAIEKESDVGKLFRTRPYAADSIQLC